MTASAHGPHPSPGDGAVPRPTGPLHRALMAWEAAEAAGRAPAVAADRAPADLPSPWRLFAHQVVDELRVHARVRALVALEVAMPLSLLVILGSLLRDVELGPGEATFARAFVPDMVAVGLATTCFAGLGISVSYLVLTGALKRLAGTPLPAWVPLAAMGVQALIVALVVAASLALVGRALLGVPLPALGPSLVVALVGGTALVALGVAASTFVRRVEAAPAVTNLVLWPMAVVSGTFAPVPPGTLIDRVGAVLPLRPLQEAMQMAFRGDGVGWAGLAVVTAWGTAGAALASMRWPATT